MFLCTEGGPTDTCARAAQLVREDEATKAFSFFAVGMEGANMDVLASISSRQPLKLSGVSRS